MHHQQHYNQREIIAGIKNRNPRIVHYFVKKLSERVKRNFKQRYPAHQHAWIEDSISQCMIILFEKIDKLPEQEQSLENYAFGIVRYTFLHYLRKSSKVEYRAPEMLPDQVQEQVQAHESAATLFYREGMDRHWLWYQQLSFRNQQILNLKTMGVPSKEIAGMVGLSDGAVRNLISKMMRTAKQLAT